jgi:gliding motility-associated-like protein
MKQTIHFLMPALIVGLFLFFKPAQAQVTIGSSVTNTSCGFNNGAITVTPSGGSGYTYQWSNGASTATISNLAAGSYTVTVYSNGAAGLDTVFFETFDPPQAWTLNVPTGVNGADNNFWQIDNDEGGVLPPGCGVAGGNQTLHITSVFNSTGGASYDAGGLCGILFCPETNMGAISPLINTTGASNMTLSIDFIGGGDALIDNGSLLYSTNGGVTVTPLDPTLKSLTCPSGQGVWTNRTYALPAAANNIANFALGFNWTNNDDGVGTDPSIAINNILITYPLAAGLDSAVATFNVAPSTGIDINTAGMVLTQPSCGSNNGSISGPQGVNGSTPYTYQWDSASILYPAGPNINNLYAGTYHLRITDNNSCTFDTTFSLTNTGIPVITISASDSSVCTGTGIQLFANIGGTGSFVWTGSNVPLPPHSSPLNVTPGATGYYVFNWTDGGACTYRDSILVTVSTPPVLSVSPNNPTICPGANLQLTASGAVGGTYTWTGGDLAGPFVGNPLSVSPISNQTYNLSWTDGGCSATATAPVTVGAGAVTLTLTASPNDTICNGSQVTLNATASVAGGTYSWVGPGLPVTNQQQVTFTPPSTTAITQHTYYVTYNGGGCNANDSITITVKKVANLVGFTNPTCGQPNGSISANGNGNNVTFQWLRNGVNYFSGPSVLSNVPTGNYSFIAYDQSTGCSDTISNIQLTDTTAFPALSNVQVTDVSCFGANDGTISFTAVGGSGNYNYTWSHDNTLNSDNAFALSAGTYDVTVNDGVCTIDTSFIVSGPTAAITATVTTQPDNCGQAVGSATVTVNGGSTPFTYNWSNTGSTATISNLIGLSNYSVTVTDNGGCTATASGFVDDIGAPTIALTGTPQVCAGGTEGSIQVTASGPGSPYTYTWSHDNTITTPQANNLGAGTYDVTVTTSLNCTATAQFIITEFAGIVFTLPDDTSIYLGQAIQIQGVTNAPYTSVIWSPDVINSPNVLGTLVSPDDTITYHVDVVYGTGCIISDEITINIITDGDSLIMPNVFTPDADGINDYYHLQSYAGINTFSIFIYDRWGNKVYEAFDPTFMWDGTDMFSGFKPMTSAVFGYMVEYTTYESFKKKRMQGNITLVR